MVPLLDAVKAEMVRGGSGKPDYRNPGAGEKTKMREESATLSFSQNLPS
jgi:hypothetical protein